MMDSNDVPSDENFIRPGDPGFTNFPKHLPEDCVSYSIYVVSSAISTPAQSRSRLKQIQLEAHELSRSLLKEYIWQRDDFALSLEHEEQDGAGAGRWTLHGKTEFGDSIADEWVIVYILRELSRKFKDAWIRLVDADGEFLLAEAANAIPSWLDPDVADNRVWINNGGLKIVPQTVSGARAKFKSSQDLEVVSLASALSYLASDPHDLIQSPEINDEAFYRLRNHPTQIHESMHATKVSIPRKLAYLLYRTPANISPAVEAFYLRDPISMRPLKVQKGANLSFPPTDLVTASVRFTRISYAQLKSQDFSMPLAWAKQTRASACGKDRSRLDMGMKVACGFEMLLADPQNQDKRSVREAKLLLEDINSGEEALPTDGEIAEWSSRDDDDSWLEVNFEDFERELSGRTKGGNNPTKNEPGSFGDTAAQENLRRIVERFEKLLDDDDDGAEFEDGTDDDDSEEDRVEVGSNESDRAELHEEDLNSMMQRVLEIHSNGEFGPSASGLGDTDRVTDSDEDDNGDPSSQDIETVMKSMEAELTSEGALNLDCSSKDSSRCQTEDDDPRFTFARNFLESFQNETGASGPASGFLASMNMTMPRNEDE